MDTSNEDIWRVIEKENIRRQGRHRLLRRISFGLEPFSNLWHAVWTTIVFFALLTVWIIEIVFGY